MGIIAKMETQTAKKTSVWLPSKATAAIITTINAPRMEPAQVKVHDESLNSLFCEEIKRTKWG